MVMTVCPPWDRTKSVTLLGGALASELEPGRRGERGTKNRCGEVRRGAERCGEVAKIRGAERR